MYITCVRHTHLTTVYILTNTVLINILLLLSLTYDITPTRHVLYMVMSYPHSVILHLYVIGMLLPLIQGAVLLPGMKYTFPKILLR